MGVYIKDVKIPKNCAECKMWGICDLLDFDDYESICDAVEDGFLVRDKNCPLVEVPTPHGRLIDADALMAEVMDSDLDHLQRDDWKEVIQIVADAPTIIEAEESGL